MSVDTVEEQAFDLDRPTLLFNSEKKTDDGDKIWSVSVLFLSKEGNEPAVLRMADSDEETGTLIATVKLDTVCGFVFWRGEIEVKLGSTSTTVTYFLGANPYSFTVPAVNEAVKVLFYSCNGFSGSTIPYGKQIGGINNTWENVLLNHRTSPFHVGVGGGDQLYCDEVLDLPILREWLGLDETSDFDRMYNEEFSEDMASAVLRFYVDNYLKQYSSSAPYGTCLASIPMINQWDDHDIYDGYGSYNADLQNCPILQGIYLIARRMYLLFQHHMTEEELDSRGYLSAEPSSATLKPSISTVKTFGNLAILALDTRSERTIEEVVSEPTYAKAFSRLENLDSDCQHLLVTTAVPLLNINISAAGNVMSALDTVEAKKAIEKANISQGERPKKLKFRISQFFEEMKINFKDTLAAALGFQNNVFGNINLIDDLMDGWDSSNHEAERTQFLRQLVAFSLRKNIRVTILSGDVHYANIARIKLPSGGCDIFNLVSSPIGNQVNGGASVFKFFGASAAKGIELEDGTDLAYKNLTWEKENGDELEEGRNYLELLSHTDGVLQARLHVEKNSDNPKDSSDFNIYERKLPACSP